MPLMAQKRFSWLKRGRWSCFGIKMSKTHAHTMKTVNFKLKFPFPSRLYNVTFLAGISIFTKAIYTTYIFYELLTWICVHYLPLNKNLNLSMYIINIIHHGKCGCTVFTHSLVCIRNNTHLLRLLIPLPTFEQLMCKYRTHSYTFHKIFYICRQTTNLQ